MSHLPQPYPYGHPDWMHNPSEYAWVQPPHYPAAGMAAPPLGTAAWPGSNEWYTQEQPPPPPAVLPPQSSLAPQALKQAALQGSSTQAMAKVSASDAADPDNEEPAPPGEEPEPPGLELELPGETPPPPPVSNPVMAAAAAPTVPAVVPPTEHRHPWSSGTGEAMPSRSPPTQLPQSTSHTSPPRPPSQPPSPPAGPPAPPSELPPAPPTADLPPPPPASSHAPPPPPAPPVPEHADRDASAPPRIAGSPPQSAAPSALDGPHTKAEATNSQKGPPGRTTPPRQIRLQSNPSFFKKAGAPHERPKDPPAPAPAPPPKDAAEEPGALPDAPAPARRASPRQGFAKGALANGLKAAAAHNQPQAEAGHTRGADPSARGTLWGRNEPPAAPGIPPSAPGSAATVPPDSRRRSGSHESFSRSYSRSRSCSRSRSRSPGERPQSPPHSRGLSDRHAPHPPHARDMRDRPPGPWHRGPREEDYHEHRHHGNHASSSRSPPRGDGRSYGGYRHDGPSRPDHRQRDRPDFHDRSGAHDYADRGRGRGRGRPGQDRYAPHDRPQYDEWPHHGDSRRRPDQRGGFDRPGRDRGPPGPYPERGLHPLPGDRGPPPLGDRDRGPRPPFERGLHPLPGDRGPPLPGDRDRRPHPPIERGLHPLPGDRGPAPPGDRDRGPRPPGDRFSGDRGAPRPIDSLPEDKGSRPPEDRVSGESSPHPPQDRSPRDGEPQPSGDQPPEEGGPQLLEERSSHPAEPAEEGGCPPAEPEPSAPQESDLQPAGSRGPPASRERSASQDRGPHPPGETSSHAPRDGGPDAAQEVGERGTSQPAEERPPPPAGEPGERGGSYPPEDQANPAAAEPRERPPHAPTDRGPKPPGDDLQGPGERPGRDRDGFSDRALRDRDSRDGPADRPHREWDGPPDRRPRNWDGPRGRYGHDRPTHGEWGQYDNDRAGSSGRSHDRDRGPDAKGARPPMDRERQYGYGPRGRYDGDRGDRPPFGRGERNDDGGPPRGLSRDRDSHDRDRDGPDGPWEQGRYDDGRGPAGPPRGDRQDRRGGFGGRFGPPRSPPGRDYHDRRGPQGRGMPRAPLPPPGPADHGRSPDRYGPPRPVIPPGRGRGFRDSSPGAGRGPVRQRSVGPPPEPHPDWPLPPGPPPPRRPSSDSRPTYSPHTPSQPPPPGLAPGPHAPHTSRDERRSVEPKGEQVPPGIGSVAAPLALIHPPGIVPPRPPEPPAAPVDTRNGPPAPPAYSSPSHRQDADATYSPEVAAAREAVEGPTPAAASPPSARSPHHTASPSPMLSPPPALSHASLPFSTPHERHAEAAPSPSDSPLLRYVKAELLHTQLVDRRHPSPRRPAPPHPPPYPAGGWRGAAPAPPARGLLVDLQCTTSRTIGTHRPHGRPTDVTPEQDAKLRAALNDRIAQAASHVGLARTWREDRHTLLQALFAKVAHEFDERLPLDVEDLFPEEPLPPQLLAVAGSIGLALRLPGQELPVACSPYTPPKAPASGELKEPEVPEENLLTEPKELLWDAAPGAPANVDPRLASRQSALSAVVPLLTVPAFAVAAQGDAAAQEQYILSVAQYSASQADWYGLYGNGGWSEAAAAELAAQEQRLHPEHGSWSFLTAAGGPSKEVYSMGELRSMAEAGQLQWRTSICRQEDGLWLPLLKEPWGSTDLEWAGKNSHPPPPPPSPPHVQAPAPVTAAEQLLSRVLPAATASSLLTPDSLDAWLERTAKEAVNGGYISRVAVAKSRAAGQEASAELLDSVQQLLAQQPGASVSTAGAPQEQSDWLQGWEAGPAMASRKTAACQSAGQRRAAASESARAEAAVPSEDSAPRAKRYRRWGPPAPPQHGAMVRGEMHRMLQRPLRNLTRQLLDTAIEHAWKGVEERRVKHEAEEKLRQEAELAEKRRLAEAEAEQQRLAELEAEKKRQEEAAARQAAEEAEKKRAAAAEQARLKAEEEQRLRAEEERRKAEAAEQASKAEAANRQRRVEEVRAAEQERKKAQAEAQRLKYEAEAAENRSRINARNFRPKGGDAKEHAEDSSSDDEEFLAPQEHAAPASATTPKKASRRSSPPPSEDGAEPAAETGGSRSGASEGPQGSESSSGGPPTRRAAGKRAAAKAAAPAKASKRARAAAQDDDDDFLQVGRPQTTAAGRTRSAPPPDEEDEDSEPEAAAAGKPTSKPRPAKRGRAGKGAEATAKQGAEEEGEQEGGRPGRRGKAAKSARTSATGGAEEGEQNWVQAQAVVDQLLGMVIRERLEEAMKFLVRVGARDCEGVFDEPVDPNEPHYYERIKTPMDLSTIQRKLSDGEYGADLEGWKRFETDVNLIWKNCLEFNQDGTEFYQLGQKFQFHAQKRLAGDLQTINANRGVKRRRG